MARSLPQVVLVHPHVAPRQPGHQVALVVLHRKRNFNKVRLHTQRKASGPCPAAGISGCCPSSAFCARLSLRQLARHRRLSVRRSNSVAIRVRSRAPARRHRVPGASAASERRESLRLRRHRGSAAAEHSAPPPVRLSSPAVPAPCTRQSSRQYALTYHAKSPILFHPATEAAQSFTSYRLPAHVTAIPAIQPARRISAHALLDAPPTPNVAPYAPLRRHFFAKLSPDFVV